MILVIHPTLDEKRGEGIQIVETLYCQFSQFDWVLQKLSVNDWI